MDAGRVTVPRQECAVELSADSPQLRLELTIDDEPIIYCAECWTRESTWFPRWRARSPGGCCP